MYVVHTIHREDNPCHLAYFNIFGNVVSLSRVANRKPVRALEIIQDSVYAAALVCLLLGHTMMLGRRAISMSYNVQRSMPDVPAPLSNLKIQPQWTRSVEARDTLSRIHLVPLCY